MIRALIREKTPPGQASTAAVKPSPEVTEAVVGEYERTCNDLLETFASKENFNTRARYKHPWFGPLNAAGWQALAGTHLAIHRAQIDRILALRSRAGVEVPV